MPQLAAKRKTSRSKTESRVSVGLPGALVRRVERYADRTDTSMSKAIAALVRLGLDSQEQRKREFLKKLRANLDNTNPTQQDRLIDEFQDIILGR